LRSSKKVTYKRFLCLRYGRGAGNHVTHFSALNGKSSKEGGTVNDVIGQKNVLGCATVIGQKKKGFDFQEIKTKGSIKEINLWPLFLHLFLH